MAEEADEQMAGIAANCSSRAMLGRKAASSYYLLFRRML